MQALRQAFSSHGRLPAPHNMVMDTAQNLFTKGFKNLNSVKYALQGKVPTFLPLLLPFILCAVKTMTLLVASITALPITCSQDHNIAGHCSSGIEQCRPRRHVLLRFPVFLLHAIRTMTLLATSLLVMRNPDNGIISNFSTLPSRCMQSRSRLCQPVPNHQQQGLSSLTDVAAQTRAIATSKQLRPPSPISFCSLSCHHNCIFTTLCTSDSAITQH